MHTCIGTVGVNELQNRNSDAFRIKLAWNRRDFSGKLFMWLTMGTLSRQSFIRKPFTLIDTFLADIDDILICIIVSAICQNYYSWIVSIRVKYKIKNEDHAD